MAQSTGEKRRIFLFNNFGNLILIKYNNENRSLLSLNQDVEPPAGAGWEKFIDLYFKTEDGVKKFFDDAKKVYETRKSSTDKQTVKSWLPKVDLNGTDVKNLFVYYACDIDTIKGSDFCKIKMNSNDYVGEYKGDTFNFKIVDRGGVLNMEDSKSFTYYKLKPKKQDEFETLPNLDQAIDSRADSSLTNLIKKTGNIVNTDNLSIDVGNLKFIKSGTEVVSVNYDIPGHKGTAKKVSDSAKKDEPKKDDKKISNNTDNKVNTSTTPEPTDTPRPINVVKYSPGVRKKEGFTTKDCGDFPFTLGCTNPKIGKINDVLFGDPNLDIYDNDLYESLYSNGYFGLSGEKKGEISKNIYQLIMQNSKKQNESVLFKKVIKENVKKVLKERYYKK